MEFLLVLLISHGTIEHNPIELKRYALKSDCYDAAELISSEPEGVARAYENGRAYNLELAYACVLVPKK